MTEYGKYTQHILTASLLSHDAVQVAKEKRRKVLEVIRQRRQEQYKQFYKKMRLQPTTK